MIGFTIPATGERFLLVGSHTSTVRVGKTPAKWPGCTGCRDRDASLAEDPKGLSREAVAARAAESGIARKEGP